MWLNSIYSNQSKQLPVVAFVLHCKALGPNEQLHQCMSSLVFHNAPLIMWLSSKLPCFVIIYYYHFGSICIVILDLLFFFKSWIYSTLFVCPISRKLVVWANTVAFNLSAARRLGVAICCSGSKSNQLQTRASMCMLGWRQLLLHCGLLGDVCWCINALRYYRSVTSWYLPYHTACYFMFCKRVQHFVMPEHVVQCTVQPQLEQFGRVYSLVTSPIADFVEVTFACSCRQSYPFAGCWHYHL